MFSPQIIISTVSVYTCRKKYPQVLTIFFTRTVRWVMLNNIFEIIRFLPETLTLVIEFVLGYMLMMEGENVNFYDLSKN